MIICSMACPFQKSKGLEALIRGSADATPVLPRCYRCYPGATFLVNSCVAPGSTVNDDYAISPGNINANHGQSRSG